MFGIKRKSQPEVIVRTETKYVTKSEDVALRTRVDDFLEKAEQEYARLSQRAIRELDRRDNGLSYAQDIAARDIAQLSILSDIIASIKGTDHVRETYRLEQLAFASRENVFPMNSFISGLTPQYAPVN